MREQTFLVKNITCSWVYQFAPGSILQNILSSGKEPLFEIKGYIDQHDKRWQFNQRADLCDEGLAGADSVNGDGNCNSQLKVIARSFFLFLF